MFKQIFKVLALLVTLSFSPNVQSASYNYQEESWVEKDKNKQSKRNALIKSIMKTLGVAACVAAICALGYKFMGKSGKKTNPETAAEVSPAATVSPSTEPYVPPTKETAESLAKETRRFVDEAILKEKNGMEDRKKELARLQDQLEEIERAPRVAGLKAMYAPIFEQVGQISNERITADGKFYFSAGIYPFIVDTTANKFFVRIITGSETFNYSDKYMDITAKEFKLGRENYIWKDGKLFSQTREQERVAAERDRIAREKSIAWNRMTGSERAQYDFADMATKQKMIKKALSEGPY